LVSFNLINIVKIDFPLAHHLKAKKRIIFGVSTKDSSFIFAVTKAKTTLINSESLTKSISLQAIHASKVCANILSSENSSPRFLSPGLVMVMFFVLFRFCSSTGDLIILIKQNILKNLILLKRR
jgi:hypothetical protein